MSPHRDPPEPVGHTVEAIVLDDGLDAGDGRVRAALRRRLEALSAFGVHLAVIGGAGGSTVDGRWAFRPPGPGRMWLATHGAGTTGGADASDGADGAAVFEVSRAGPLPVRRPTATPDGDAGPARATTRGGEARPARAAARGGEVRPARAAAPDGDAGPVRAATPDPLRAVLDRLAEYGIGPGLVLVVRAAPPGGDPPWTGPGERCRVLSVADPARGPAVLRRVLDEQLRRRRSGRVPGIDADPEWTLTESGPDPLRTRVAEALLTLGAGGFGTRGSVEEPAPGSVPLVLASGIYAGEGPEQHPLPGPVWTALDVHPAPAADRRTLDLRTGVLLREELHTEQPLRVLRLASAALPGAVAMSAEAAAGRLRPSPPLRVPAAEGAPPARWPASVDGEVWSAVTAGRQGGIAAAAVDSGARDRGLRTVRRIAGYVADPNRAPDPDRAVELLATARAVGFDRLLAEHRHAWARRWEDVDVTIPDDEQAQLAVRFALFCLWCNASRHGAGAVGARGLSGPGYRGHVFWDTDVFVLPAVASMDPDAARAMLEYRHQRLAAARAAARAAGRRGARFPWESAADGTDVTPPAGYVGGQPVPILTGELEEHITADVAWAAWQYGRWVGDTAFAGGPGRELLLETARYWASRCRVDAAGRAHLDGVIGPDEYHESVDDNAYTNVMVRWNLRRAAEAAGPGPDSDEWRRLADRIVDGYDPATGRYEQFTGYFGLRPLLAADVATPPFAADVLLGRQQLAATQLIKQADVLMLHHVVPGEVAPGSLAPNLDFYLPRTSHGSSLSPAISASLLARAGRPDEACALLRMALRLDLDDLTGTTAGGLHLATVGGVWQAILFGLVGASVDDGTLHLDPCLPAAWPRLGVRFRVLGRRVRVGIGPGAVEVRTDGPLRVAVSGRPAGQVDGHTRFEIARRPA